MFADQLRSAVEASPRVKLPELAAHLWRALAEGQVTEAEAESLSALIELKRVPPQKPVAASRKAVGSRPRSDASMERRRRWAASGRLPPALATRFTLAEQAVLSVVATQVREKGSCSLTIGHIAALAGVSETTVRNAIREARQLGFVTVEERRLTAWRNASNVVRIVSVEWTAWLRLSRPAGGGCKSAKPTNTMILAKGRQAEPMRQNRDRAREWKPVRSLIAQ